MPCSSNFMPAAFNCATRYESLLKWSDCSKIMAEPTVFRPSEPLADPILCQLFRNSGTLAGSTICELI